MSAEALPPWPEPINELDPSDDDLLMWRNDMIYALRERLDLARKTLEEVRPDCGSHHGLVCDCNTCKVLIAIKEPSDA